jgi:hypothetical protein
MRILLFFVYFHSNCGAFCADFATFALLAPMPRKLAAAAADFSWHVLERFSGGCTANAKSLSFLGVPSGDILAGLPTCFEVGLCVVLSVDRLGLGLEAFSPA